MSTNVETMYDNYLTYTSILTLIVLVKEFKYCSILSCANSFRSDFERLIFKKGRLNL